MPVKVSQTVEESLELIYRFGLSHVPVLDDENFGGNLLRETLEESESKSVISELGELTEFFYITENGSLLDAVQNFHQADSNVLPVLNRELKYVGLLLLEDVIQGLSAMPFIFEPGSIIIVEINHKRFSISEIAKIAESNNARIIGLFITRYRENHIQIALKLIADNLTSIGETFERFDYTVVYKFFNDEKDEMMKDRFNQLMKYLDI